MSVNNVLANTKLPAPINAILNLIINFLPKYYSNNMPKDNYNTLLCIYKVYFYFLHQYFTIIMLFQKTLKYMLTFLPFTLYNEKSK